MSSCLHSAGVTPKSALLNLQNLRSSTALQLKNQGNFLKPTEATESFRQPASKEAKQASTVNKFIARFEQQPVANIEKPQENSNKNHLSYSSIYAKLTQAN